MSFFLSHNVWSFDCKYWIKEKVSIKRVYSNPLSMIFIVHNCKRCPIFYKVAIELLKKKSILYYIYLILVVQIIDSRVLLQFFGGKKMTKKKLKKKQTTQVWVEEYSDKK